MYCSIHASCSNAQGESRSSKNVEEVQTLGQVPEAPSNPVDFVHPSNTSVRLDLFMWNKQTCPVDYFIVSYRKENVSGILKKLSSCTMNTKTLLRFCPPSFQDLHWTLVSNDLGLRSRRFTIRQLEPETAYELKIKANSPAGSTDFSYRFETVSSSEASAGTQLVIRLQIFFFTSIQLFFLFFQGIGSTQFKNGAYPDPTDLSTQLQLMVPVILGLMLVLIAVAGFAVCIKRSKCLFYTY